MYVLPEAQRRSGKSSHEQILRPVVVKSGGLGKRDFAKINFYVGRDIGIVGQRVQRDVGDDLDDFAIGEGCAANSRQISVTDLTAGSSTRLAKVRAAVVRALPPFPARPSQPNHLSDGGVGGKAVGAVVLLAVTRSRRSLVFASRSPLPSAPLKPR